MSCLVYPSIRKPDSNCSGGTHVGLKWGSSDEGLGERVQLTLLLPSSSWLTFGMILKFCKGCGLSVDVDVIKLFSSTHREVENEL